MNNQITKTPANTQHANRILVVDDDTMTRNLMYHLLKRYYIVDSVSNGKSALEALEETEYDLVLTDIMMPGINGLQLLGHIRAQEKFVDLPIILITAMGSTDDVVNGLKMGANDYIVKPADTEIVLARVRNQIMMKRLTDENKRAMNQLAELSDMRAELMNIAAHDLKNPLHNISLASNVLRSLVGHVEEASPILNNVQDAVKNMEGILKSFLDVMTLQSGRLELNIRKMSLAIVVEQVVNQNRIAAHNKDITLNVENVDGMIEADLDRMFQVLGNMVSNAIKYSPYGTTVDIWAEPAENGYRLCVRDQGPGIKPEERDMLFKQFSKTSNMPTGSESSTGLGLWIIKQLVQRFDGLVGADFPTEGGSIFWIELPAAVEEVMHIQETAS
ncbi:MAG: response regulator [Anaerolineae bacterium]|nr:response regulator [Anaerolineae bacterium]MCA9889322.1 response regulator [Anaerolineae bacterium]